MKKIALLVLLFLPFLSLADSPRQEITQLKIASLQFYNSFSSFVYFHGDDRSRARLLIAQARVDKALLALSTSSDKLSIKWKQISEYLKSYQVKSLNGPDMRLAGVWNILQAELTGIIKDLEKELPESDDLSEQSEMMNVQVRMEMILSRYMAYATSATGGYGISDEETPLEKDIVELSDKLTKLANGDEQYKPLLKQWMYIQGTLLAYNTNVAPFVVLHTFDRMRNLIASE